MAHSHIIGRQIFDIQFTSREQAHELQNKFSRIFNSELSASVERVLDERIPSNRLFKIDTLTIDIGSIAFDQIEAELTDRVTRKLEEELNLYLLHDNSAVQSGGEMYPDSVYGNYLTLLEYFLLGGSLPWWAGPNLSNPLEAIEYLLANSAPELRLLLIRIGTNSNVRSRLVLQFSEEIIRGIIDVLQPEEAEFIIGYHKRVVQLQHQKQLVKTEASVFSKAVWNFILTYLLVDRGSHFNRKTFVKATLQNMASHFNLEFAAILDLFTAALRSNLSEFKNIDSLEAIIFEIAGEEVRTAPGRIRNVPTAENLREKIIKDFEVLSYFVSNQSLPVGFVDFTRSELNRIIAQLIRHIPKSVFKLLHEQLQQETGRAFLVRAFDEEQLTQIVSLLEPGQGEFITDYISEIKTVHTTNKIIQAQTEDLTYAVWEFVLQYLVVDRGSEFNRQIFLESNIRRLANRFNVQYAELLVMMVQNIGVFHYSSSRHLALFHGLSALFHKSQQAVGEILAGDSFTLSPEGSSLKEKRFDMRQRGFADVLFYWVRYGYLPWWAGNLFHSSPASMLEDLIDKSPLAAVQVLKYAGLQEQTRQRLLLQIPPRLMREVFFLAAGSKSQNDLEALTDYFNDIPEEKLSLLKISRSALVSVYLQVVWNNLIVSGYEQIDLQSLLKELAAAILSADPSRSGNINEVFSVPASNTASVVHVFWQTLHEQREQGWGEPWFTIDWSGSAEIQGVIRKKISMRGLQGDAPQKEQTVSEALHILRQYLASGKLPDEYLEFAGVSQYSFLKKLLNYLFKEALPDLESLLESRLYSAERLLMLHDLTITANSIEESRLAVFMRRYTVIHITLFFQQSNQLSADQNSVSMFVGELLKRSPNSTRSEMLAAATRFLAAADYFSNYVAEEYLYQMLGSGSLSRGWGTETVAHLKSFNLWLAAVMSAESDLENLNYYFRTFSLLMLGGTVKVSDFKSFMIAFFKFVYRRNYQLLHKLAQYTEGKYLIDRSDETVLTEEHQSLVLSELARYTLREKYNQDIRDSVNSDIGPAPSSSVRDEHRTDRKELLQKELEENTSLEKKTRLATGLEEEESIYIRNAGLVLLHPFLGTYFKRLNMFENGDFASEEMRHRAVHLLQYLVFGTEKNEEHELVLNKIFCNIPVEIPVPLEITLTELERTVSGELLQAVIAQWDKLKNTSVESLQVSFLQREGALRLVDESWNLKVEQRGYDVLLQTLPWGLGMVRTPWMSDFIYVEWM